MSGIQPGFKMRATSTALSLCLWLLSGSGSASAQETPAVPAGAFLAPRPSTAVDVKPGDLVRGPGPLTVGWAGSKKQVLVAGGPWLVLAVVDHKSTHARPVQLTSVALGQFQLHRLTALMVATFNRTSGLAGHTWKEAADCEVESPRALLQVADGSFALRRCLFVSELRPSQELNRSYAVSAQVKASLETLGATSAGFNLETAIYLVNARAAYMRIIRFDCVGAVGDGAKCPMLAKSSAAEAPASPLEARLAWAKAYLTLSAEAFARDIPGRDLSPGAPAQGTSVKLPD